MHTGWSTAARLVRAPHAPSAQHMLYHTKFAPAPACLLPLKLYPCRSSAPTVAAKMACVVGDSGVSEGPLLGPLMGLPLLASSIRVPT